jgi:hypothetical protein
VARPFRRTRAGVEARLSEAEAGLVRLVCQQLLDLLAPDRADEGQVVDPLDALVGIPVGTPQLPADPALARLLPDAYPDDPEAAAEFRRYTETSLRAEKREAAERVLGMLQRGRRFRLTDEEAQAWLTLLTDARLVLATRLGIQDEEEAAALERLSRSDPRAQLAGLYGWLGWVQETLVHAVADW